MQRRDLRLREGSHLLKITQLETAIGSQEAVFLMSKLRGGKDDVVPKVFCTPHPHPQHPDSGT